MNPYRKGRDYEREVADIFTGAGFDVRGLEAGGDHLIVQAGGLVLASECKRAERLKIPEWWRQASTDAPKGTVPLLTFRQSRQESLTVIRTADLARLLGQ